MTHHSDTTAMEADIDRDRAALASTLDALQDRVSIEHLAQEALGMIRSNAAAYTRSLDQAVRANPLAVALTAAGLAWLIFGNKKPAAKPAKPVALSRWEDEGGSLVLPGHTTKASGEAEWWRAVDALRDKASDKLRQIEDQSRAFADNLSSGLSAGVAGGLGEARDYAVEKAAVVADLAQGMKGAIAHGLDGLSEAARDRILAAREQAYAARLRAERSVKSSLSKPGRLIEEHPMIAGVVGLAVGAAFAASLPRTVTEDRVFGTESDRLLNEAGRLLRQEQDRIARIAGAVKDELQDSAKEAMASVSEIAAETADRVKDRAETEAAADKKPNTAPQTADAAPATSTAAPKRPVG